jgi:hypothetical protein
MQQAKVQESKSGGKMVNMFDLYLQVTAKSLSKTYISDKIYHENLRQRCQMCHIKSC